VAPIRTKLSNQYVDTAEEMPGLQDQLRSPCPSGQKLSINTLGQKYVVPVLVALYFKCPIHTTPLQVLGFPCCPRITQYIRKLTSWNIKPNISWFS